MKCLDSRFVSGLFADFTVKGHFVQRRTTSLVLILSVAAFLLYAVLKIPTVSTGAFEYVIRFKSHWFMQKKVVAGWSGWLFYEPELAYVTSELPAENERHIVAFDRMLRQHGMTLFVVPIPNKIEIYPEKFTLLPAPHPVKKERGCLLRQLENDGVKVIDLVPPFEQAKHSGRLFDPYDTHWTTLGIEVAAQVIARAIDSVLVSRNITRDPRYGVRDTVLQTCSDLFDKLHNDHAPTWRPTAVKRVVSPDGSLYTEGRKSEILIVGDSFVNHGKWWNANLGAQLARLIGHPTRTYFNLLANVNGPCMYQSKPGAFPENGVVIWAFTSRVLRYSLGDPEKESRLAMAGAAQGR
jgi:hypothetical protein